MKRFLTLLLVLLSIVPIAHAENAVDLTAMTAEELVILRDAVNFELAARNFKDKEVAVPPGRYTVGIDIPVGVYTLTIPSSYSSVDVNTPDGRFDIGFMVTPEKPVGKLELTEGQTVEILYGSVTFKPYVGLGF